MKKKIKKLREIRLKKKITRLKALHTAFIRTVEHFLTNS